MTLKVAVIGAGRIGQIHCHNLLYHIAEAKLQAVCDPFINNCGTGIEVSHKEEDHFWQLDFDAVIIASPSEFHKMHVIRAIEKGVHIFCEKPLAIDLKVNQEIAKSLRGYPKIFQIGFNRRFDKDFKKIRDLHKASLSKPYLLQITSRDPCPPDLQYLKHSGGLFFDMTIHDFDMARFIMDSEITQIFASASSLVDANTASIKDVDTAIVTLRFANGAYGVIDNCRKSSYGYDQRVEILSSAGSLSNDNHSKTSIQLANDSGIHQECNLNFFQQRYESSFVEEIRAFVEACICGQPKGPDVIDALRSIQLAHAATTSLKSKQPVRLSYDA